MSDLDIPEFLKRPVETEEQADARRAKYKKPDMSDGLKLKKLPEPLPPAIAKALAREFGSEKPAPKQTGELPRLVARAVAENATRNQPMETEMAKSKKAKTPKAKAKKAKAPKKAPKNIENGGTSIRPGSKVEMVANLLRREGGCTASDVLLATGWPSVSMPAQAKQAGLVLKKEKNKGEPTRYFAA